MFDAVFWLCYYQRRWWRKTINIYEKNTLLF